MTKVQIKYGETTVEIDAGGVKDVFKACTEFEVLGETTCWACSSNDVSPRHRVAQGYDFYSMKCNNCGAELSFGQLRDSEGLFPKRKGQDGGLLADNGWVKYNPQGSEF